ncbi:MAG: S-layer homology domain-containing protein [Clostridia bacterium]|nr:S-layer homology domain-containing protein [Clostridia bacterium]
MKKQILSLLLAVSILMGGITFAAAEFTDVAESDYFYPAVQWGAEAGITYGVDEEHFDPEGEVTRAQVVTFLWSMAGQPEPAATETFSDVEAGSWYETAVKWAVENEITEGTGDNMFSPDVICDRAMCITLLYRLMGCPFDGMDLTADVELDENSTMEDFGFYLIKEMVKGIREQGLFSDVPEESYFEYPVFWGLMNGIITEANSGITAENMLFRSADPCVRGEMISFLYQTKLLEDAKNAPITYESGPVVLPIPKKYYDEELISFYVYGVTDEEYLDEDFEEENVIVVYEKASQDAAEAMDEDTEGAGELCRIVRVTEDKLHSLLSGDMSGIKVFAKDTYGKYYLFCTPTDVRIVRQTNEELSDAMEQWSELNEWARGELCNEILSNSSELIPVNFTNTELDMYLARIAYDKYTDYTISSAEFGELNPGNVDTKPYVERLLGGTFVELEDIGAPEGEYITLNFPKDEVRFDFFIANKNLVREVHGESETIYKRGFNNSEGGINNTDIIQEWYYALAEKAGKK